MEVKLKPTNEQFVQHELETGRYGSSDQVINASLHRMQSLQRLDVHTLDELREALQKGFEVPMAPFDRDAVIAKGKQLLEERSSDN